MLKTGFLKQVYLIHLSWGTAFVTKGGVVGALGSTGGPIMPPLPPSDAKIGLPVLIKAPYGDGILMYNGCLADGWAGHPRDRPHCHPTDRPLDHSREHPRNHPPDCPTAPPKQFAVVLCVLLDGVGWGGGREGGCREESTK